jgi:hypothetical protein
MKKTFILAALTALVAATAVAENKPAAEAGLKPEQAEANYTKTIESRTADILKELALTDTNKVTAVHDAVIAQYRALKAWHDENDAGLKAASKAGDTNKVAQIKASLKAVHDAYIARLSKSLTPAQVDQVKDKMTYNVVHVTYNAYVKMYPDLTDAEKKQILAWLIEARESSMDQGSSDEKHAVFGKYKGRINNYLSKAGYDAKTGKKKAGQAQSSSTSTNQPVK